MISQKFKVDLETLKARDAQIRDMVGGLLLTLKEFSAYVPEEKGYCEWLQTKGQLNYLRAMCQTISVENYALTNENAELKATIEELEKRISE